MSSYMAFAEVYDIFMKDTPYDAWFDYIKRIWKTYGLSPRIVLDLACGTGNMTLRMAKDGYDCIGVDISPDMLAAASAKAEKAGTPILFLNQDMADFELYGTVQAVVCLCDSVNYLTKKRDMAKMLSLVRNYLEPGGLFIFDIVSRYKFERIIAGNRFAEAGNKAAYIMSGNYDPKRHINEYEVSFFIKSGIKYLRADERHVQRAHSVAEMTGLIAESGLELCAAYDELSFDAPGGRSERIFFVVRRN